MSRYLVDRISRRAMLILASISFIILLGIVIFIFKDGVAAFIENGVGGFLFGTEWSLREEEFGILPLITGSIYVTLGTLVIATPLGIACAIFLAEVAPYRVRQVVRPAIDLLVGIPSVVYGLVGMIWLVPLIRNYFGGPGYSLLAAIIVLTIMVLPTIVSISEDSLRSVPRAYKEGALALGATHWQSIWRVTLPAARSGLVSAVILGMGRAIGEAMAVYMVIGNSFIIPASLLDPARTLTSNIVGQIEEAAYGSSHMQALFACGIVLLI
ncbi:MAG: phosphate ABC transporter permease subunit PstC, partial [Chloroflexota bacterium]|nr:phosphate ABC transporter permease subunit PstC [Chloroflexota bacterium]